MTKWKWKEEKSTVDRGHPMEAFDFGWYCENCGTDLAKYLDKSGYTNYINYPGIKRRPPKLKFCPCCGKEMEVKE